MEREVKKMKKVMLKASLLASLICIAIGNIPLVEAYDMSTYPSELQSNVGENKAKEIMKKKVPNGTLVNFTYNEMDVKPSFEGLLIKNAKEYHLEVDALTGHITEYKENKININEDNYKGTVITPQEAREIMIKRAGGGNIEDFRYDGNEAIPIYEGKVVNGFKTLKIMLDARDGKIIGIQK